MVENKVNNKKYIMLLKAVPAANMLAIVTISGPLGTQSNTNIAELNKQLVEWYREMIT